MNQIHILQLIIVKKCNKLRNKVSLNKKNDLRRAIMILYSLYKRIKAMWNPNFNIF